MFDENQEMNDLANLTTKKQLVFAASCCERLFPFYSAFAKIMETGDPAFLKSVIGRIWRHCLLEEFSEPELKELYTTCLNLVPDSEEFESAYSSEAIDASASICYALSFCQSPDPELLDTIARLSLEAVVMYLGVVNDPILDFHAADPALENWVRQAPLLVAEKKKQENDIRLLASNREITFELIDAIRQSSSAMSVNPIRRGLL